jgi:hypothetical protein
MEIFFLAPDAYGKASAGPEEKRRGDNVTVAHCRRDRAGETQSSRRIGRVRRAPTISPAAQSMRALKIQDVDC